MSEDAKSTTGATPAEVIPENLKKFYEEGKLNVAKLSQSVQEAEHMAHEATQKRAEVERAYAILAGEREAGAYGGAAGRTAEADGDGNSEEKPLTQAEAAPVVQAFIELIHPEIAVDPATNAPKNQKFVDGLREFVRDLPLPMKQAIAKGDFKAQDWAIKKYKALSGVTQRTVAPQGEKPNFIEGATPPVGDGKKVWTAEEIKTLYKQNPKEYARLADTEIAEAYNEGRVK